MTPFSMTHTPFLLPSISIDLEMPLKSYIGD